MSERVKNKDDKYYLLKGQSQEIEDESIFKNDNTGKEIVIKDLSTQIVEDRSIGEKMGEKIQQLRLI